MKLTTPWLNSGRRVYVGVTSSFSKAPDSNLYFSSGPPRSTGGSHQNTISLLAATRYVTFVMGPGTKIVKNKNYTQSIKRILSCQYFLVPFMDLVGVWALIPVFYIQE